MVMGETPNWVWYAAASIAGFGAGVIARKVRMDIRSSEIPDELAYFGASVKNPYPVEAINAKRSAGFSYSFGRIVGALLR